MARQSRQQSVSIQSPLYEVVCEQNSCGCDERLTSIVIYAAPVCPGAIKERTYRARIKAPYKISALKSDFFLLRGVYWCSTGDCWDDFPEASSRYRKVKTSHKEANFNSIHE